MFTKTKKNTSHKYFCLILVRYKIITFFQALSYFYSFLKNSHRSDKHFFMLRTSISERKRKESITFCLDKREGNSLLTIPFYSYKYKFRCQTNYSWLQVSSTGIPVGTLSLGTGVNIYVSSVVLLSLLGSSLDNLLNSFLLGNLGGLLSDLK